MTTGKKGLSEESKSLLPTNIFQSPVPNIQFSENILRSIIYCFVFTFNYKVLFELFLGVKYSFTSFRNILGVFEGVYLKEKLAGDAGLALPYSLFLGLPASFPFHAELQCIQIVIQARKE